jgi:hypothetical protein
MSSGSENGRGEITGREFYEIGIRCDQIVIR